jgi:peptidyl-prolyl cis-trans isomerase SurA
MTYSTRYKYLSIACSLFFMIGSMPLAMSAVANKPAPKAQPLDTIVATVNDTIITQSEFQQALDAAKKQFAGSYTPVPPADILDKQVLDQLINRKLQLELAEKAGIHVDKTEVAKIISNIANENKITLPELYQKLATQGMTPQSYRKEILEELTLQKIQQQEVAARIVITPQEVDDFIRSAAWKAYNNKEYHLEDILSALPENPSPEDVATAKKEAETLLDKIHHGMKFSDAAVAGSNGTKALQGGDLGWRKLPQVPTAFADQLIHMKENDVVGPIQAPNGFHLVKLAGIRVSSGEADKAAQHKQIEQLIYQRKIEESLQSWMTKIRSEAFINLSPAN